MPLSFLSTHHIFNCVQASWHEIQKINHRNFLRDCTDETCLNYLLTSSTVYKYSHNNQLNHLNIHILMSVTIYTTYVCMHIPFIFVSPRKMLSEWVLRHNLGTTVSTLEQDSHFKKGAIFLAKIESVPFLRSEPCLGWLLWGEEMYYDHSDGNTLETGHSVHRGFGVKSAHHIYFSSEKRYFPRYP